MRKLAFSLSLSYIQQCYYSQFSPLLFLQLSRWALLCSIISISTNVRERMKMHKGWNRNQNCILFAFCTKLRYVCIFAQSSQVHGFTFLRTQTPYFIPKRKPHQLPPLPLFFPTTGEKTNDLTVIFTGQRGREREKTKNNAIKDTYFNSKYLMLNSTIFLEPLTLVKSTISAHTHTRVLSLSTMQIYLFNVSE